MKLFIMSHMKDSSIRDITTIFKDYVWNIWMLFLSLLLLGHPYLLFS